MIYRNRKVDIIEEENRWVRKSELKKTISETLVIPLYGRAHCSKKYPEVFAEPETEKIGCQNSF